MRNWKSVALGSACLLAVGCGGGGETASAELESESMGGERVGAGATEDPYVAYESDTFGTEGEIAAETDTRDTYSGGMTGDIEQEEEMTGELAQGTQEPIGEEPIVEQPVEQEPMGQEPMAMTAEEVCPADIEGLNVRASTIPRGGALVFTVGREQVQDLRDRLNRFAELHMQQHQGAHGASGMQHEPGMGTPSGGATVGAGGAEASGTIGAGGTESGEGVEFVDAQALIHQASEVRVVETPRGARLEVRLDEPDRVSDLRAELREDATMLREGRCPLALQIAS